MEHTETKSPVLDLVCPPQTDLLALVRNVVGAVSQSLGFPPDEMHEIEMSVDEACTNVIRHAYDDRSTDDDVLIMRIQIAPASDRLAIRVIDHGVGPPAATDRGVADVEEYAAQAKPCGLGSLIIRRFMDEVSYESPSGHGTILSMVKYLRSAPAEHTAHGG
jgi:anti-sigma regulatory factor (Ser/Thr protein kinase)